jgi:hypothetical protein
MRDRHEIDSRSTPLPSVPWFGVRKLARSLIAELDALRSDRDSLREQLDKLGAMSLLELEARRDQLRQEIVNEELRLQRAQVDGTAALRDLELQHEEIRKAIVATEDVALLQQAGVYEYRHPLTDAVA